jgi:hypothetical protein
MRSNYRFSRPRCVHNRCPLPIDRSKLIDEKYERLQRICVFYTDGAPLFFDYLRLDMKMRYFWPFVAGRKIGDPQSTKRLVLSTFELLKRKWEREED